MHYEHSRIAPGDHEYAEAIFEHDGYAIPYQQTSDHQLASSDPYQTFPDLSSYVVPACSNEAIFKHDGYAIPYQQTSDHQLASPDPYLKLSSFAVPYLPNRRATVHDPPTDQHQRVVPDSSNTDDAPRIGEIIFNPMFIGLSRNTDGRPDHKAGEINVDRDPPPALPISFFKKPRYVKYCLLLVIVAAIAVAVTVSMRSVAGGQLSASASNLSSIISQPNASDATVTPTRMFTTTTSFIKHVFFTSSPASVSGTMAALSTSSIDRDPSTEHPGTLPPLDLFPP